MMNGKTVPEDSYIDNGFTALLIHFLGVEIGKKIEN